MARTEPTSQPAASPAAAALRFGPSLRFELQPAEHRLLVDGQPAGLGRRALDLLVALAAQPGHLLTKDELLDRVWPGLVVEEANLQMQISNLRKLLGGEIIATVPGRGYRFTAEVGPAASASASAPSPAPAPVAAPAPAMAPSTPVAHRGLAHRLIGRDDDLARLEALLQGGGCVTLVGSSGVGKTSLARAAAARSSRRCVWVDLATLTQGSQVAGALARALHLQLSGSDDDAPAQLVASLRGQALLLVLDNAEHLIQACADWAARLRPLVGAQLLVTSQAPLAVAGEQVLRLEPLTLPGPESSLGDGALALLVERIVAADHRFVVTSAQLPVLRAICVQLDGLPLALEMVATRVPLLGLQGVHDALAERFALLTRGRRDAAARHRTLHNALEWSYRLLEPEEQRLFRALGVFAGGFTLELAVALMTDDAHARWDVIDGLAALVDRSLVVVGSDDPPRYRLLETMRAFAIEHLAASPATAAALDPAGEEAGVRRRHAAALLALCERRSARDAAATAQCLAEMENVREAVAWARHHDLDIAARLTRRIFDIATFSAWRHEAGNWMLALESDMNLPAGQAVRPEVQAAWWTERARAALMRRDANASATARRAVELWRGVGQAPGLRSATLVWVRSITAAGPELDQAYADLQAQVAAEPDLPLQARYAVAGALASAASIRGDHEAALAGREAEKVLAQQLGYQDAAYAAESNIVYALSRLDRNTEAAQRGQALLARVDADGSGANANMPWVLAYLLDALLALGRLQEARELGPRILAAGRRFDTPIAWPYLCGLAALEQRYEVAAALAGYARHSHEARDMTFDPVEEAHLRRAVDAASSALGNDQAHALLQKGRTLDEDAAEALAQAESTGVTSI